METLFKILMAMLDVSVLLLCLLMVGIGMLIWWAPIVWYIRLIVSAALIVSGLGLAFYVIRTIQSVY